MDLLFYTITRDDEEIVDTHNETPYLICNDYEAALEALDKLPTGPHYRIECIEINTEMCSRDLICETAE